MKPLEQRIEKAFHSGMKLGEFVHQECMNRKRSHTAEWLERVGSLWAEVEKDFHEYCAWVEVADWQAIG